jgi:hypothetical protein
MVIPLLDQLTCVDDQVHFTYGQVAALPTDLRFRMAHRAA